MTLPIRNLLVHWRSLLTVLVPLVLLPLVTTESKEARCGFVVIVMAVFWMTEVVPLPITSLLPVVLFPLLGVLDTDRVCIAYLKETNMMFIGGLIVAIAVENCNLHKRIALRIVLSIGVSPRRLIAGFMFTTMCLSMWMNNTATTAMMIPIVHAVIEELKTDVEDARRPSLMLAPADLDHASAPLDPEVRRKSNPVVKLPKDEQEMLPRPDKDTICYYLGISYASSLGGTGTLTGTGTNLTFKGIFDSIFPDAHGINFASWMIFNIPLMLLNMIGACLWLQIVYMGLFRKNAHEMSEEKARTVKRVIRKKYEELGPMSFHEASTLTIFITVVLLWFFRKPEFIPGWAEYISSVEIQDATPVMLVVFLLFVLPSNLDFLHFGSNGEAKVSPALLHWKMVHEKIPWGLVLLLGGGFAMAAASKESGLSKLVGHELVALEVLPTFVTLILICVATMFLTELSSNTAVANIVLPVLAEMAIVMKVHPLYFMMPATLCSSYSFMLPVGTPPNAIVQAACNMRTRDMVKGGIGLKVVCLLMTCILFPTLASYIYNLHEFPEYANHYVNIDVGNITHA